MKRYLDASSRFTDPAFAKQMKMQQARVASGRGTAEEGRMDAKTMARLKEIRDKYELPDGEYGRGTPPELAFLLDLVKQLLYDDPRVHYGGAYGDLPGLQL